MPYVLTFGIIVLTAGLFWGRFTIRRPNTSRRDVAACAGTEESLVDHQLPEFATSTPLRQALAFDSRSWDQGLEYHFHSKAGLLTIAPLPGLPSAVELRICGKVWGTYISAKLAADAVASSLTSHEQLAALPVAERPATLEDWEKSRPHHFRT